MESSEKSLEINALSVQYEAVQLEKWINLALGGDTQTDSAKPIEFVSAQCDSPDPKQPDYFDGTVSFNMTDLSPSEYQQFIQLFQRCALCCNLGFYKSSHSRHLTSQGAYKKWFNSGFELLESLSVDKNGNIVSSTSSRSGTRQNIYGSSSSNPFSTDSLTGSVNNDTHSNAFGDARHFQYHQYQGTGALPVFVFLRDTYRYKVSSNGQTIRHPTLGAERYIITFLSPPKGADVSEGGLRQRASLLSIDFVIKLLSSGVQVIITGHSYGGLMARIFTQRILSALEPCPSTSPLSSTKCGASNSALKPTSASSNTNRMRQSLRRQPSSKISASTHHSSNTTEASSPLPSTSHAIVSECTHHATDTVNSKATSSETLSKTNAVKERGEENEEVTLNEVDIVPTNDLPEFLKLAQSLYCITFAAPPTHCHQKIGRAEWISWARSHVHQIYNSQDVVPFFATALSSTERDHQKLYSILCSKKIVGSQWDEQIYFDDIEGKRIRDSLNLEPKQMTDAVVRLRAALQGVSIWTITGDAGECQIELSSTHRIESAWMRTGGHSTSKLTRLFSRKKESDVLPKIFSALQHHTIVNFVESLSSVAQSLQIDANLAIKPSYNEKTSSSLSPTSGHHTTNDLDKTINVNTDEDDDDENVSWQPRPGLDVEITKKVVHLKDRTLHICLFGWNLTHIRRIDVLTPRKLIQTSISDSTTGNEETNEQMTSMMARSETSTYTHGVGDSYEVIAKDSGRGDSSIINDGTKSIASHKGGQLICFRELIDEAEETVQNDGSLLSSIRSKNAANNLMYKNTSSKLADSNDCVAEGDVVLVDMYRDESQLDVDMELSYSSQASSILGIKAFGASVARNLTDHVVDLRITSIFSEQIILITADELTSNSEKVKLSEFFYLKPSDELARMLFLRMVLLRQAHLRYERAQKSTEPSSATLTQSSTSAMPPQISDEEWLKFWGKIEEIITEDAVSMDEARSYNGLLSIIYRWDHRQSTAELLTDETELTGVGVSSDHETNHVFRRRWELQKRARVFWQVIARTYKISAKDQHSVPEEILQHEFRPASFKTKLKDLFLSPEQCQILQNLVETAWPEYASQIILPQPQGSVDEMHPPTDGLFGEPGRRTQASSDPDDEVKLTRTENILLFS